MQGLFNRARMRVVNHFSFAGANVWSAASGLLVIMEYGQEDAAFLQWKPSPDGAARALNFVQETFAVAADSAGNWLPRTLCDARVPAVELLLLAAEILVRDFCVRPAMGRLVNVQGNHIRVFFPCEEPSVGLPAWILSMEACAAQVCSGDTADLRDSIRQRYWTFRHSARQHGLNQTNIALARAAWRRDIPHYRVAPPGQTLQLGQGCLRQRVRETATDRTSGLARALSGDKFATSAFLASQGIPTSQPHVVGSAEQAVRVQQHLKVPVVVKPRAAGKGMGVSVNLSREEDLITAFEHAARLNTGVIVERFVQGDDYRLLVVGGRFVAAAKRVPAHVIGDGRASVRQLIEKLNLDPRRGLPFERLLEWVEADAEAVSVLAEAGLTLEAVPALDRSVPLRRAANLSRGGTSVDATDLIHPDNRALAERAAQLIGLDVTGIDFLTPDPTISWRNISCAILEVNSSPGLRPHLSANPQRDVLGPIIDSLYPEGSASRVPTAGITGSIGKTTTCRMVAAILGHGGARVGLSTTQGVYVDGDPLWSGDFAGGAGACQLLLNPRVQAGVFELARGGLLKKGLVIDGCDVGAVLNVHDNHIGLNGVASREDLARVKRLVVENARKMAVLNADEPMCLAMREHIAASICLVTERPDNPAVQEHRLAGGAAAVLEGPAGAPMLKLYAGDRIVGEMPAADIPASWGGAFRPAMVNALYAAAIAHGLGIGFAAIAAALAKFQSTAQSNPGRMNFYENRPFRVLVTWADGRHSIADLARFVQSREVHGTKRLLLCAMGNRPDNFLLETGAAAAAAFGQYICCDWVDLRGRPPRATAALLAQGLTGAGVPHQSVAVAADYDDGLRMAFDSALPGDLLVVTSFFSEKTHRAIMARVGA